MSTAEADILDPVLAYANDVLAGKVVAGRLVQLACERHLRDTEEGPARGLTWDLDAALHAIEFFRHLRLTEGEFEGEPFELEPWQKFIVGSLFGWKGSDGFRRFRTAYIEIGKGNGKALSLDTPIPVPGDQTVPMGVLLPGDYVLDEFGKPCRVNAVTDAMFGRTCFRVKFSDGAEIIADSNHLWRTTSLDGETAVLTTHRIAGTLAVKGTWNHRVDDARFIVAVDRVRSVPVKCISVDNPTGMFLAGHAHIPTHNSPIAGGIGLYGLVADGESGAEIYAAAVSRDQAGILFRDAKNMAEGSPALRKRLDINQFNIAYPATKSYFRPVSSEGRGLDGKRVHMALIDEVHEHRTPVVVDKMRAGTKGRRAALICEITNSGYDRNTVCWHHHEYSRKILEEILSDDSWFAYVCQLDPCEPCRQEGKMQPTDGCPECDDWRDEKTWPKANPNLGISIKPKYLREQVREAMGMPAKESIVKRLNFCCWVEAAVHAIPMDKWDACAQEIDRESLKGRECFGGLDIGATSDFTAFSLLFPHDDVESVEIPADPLNPDGDKKLVYRRSYSLLPWYWLPEHPVKRDPRMAAIIDGWRRQGLIRTTPGEVVDYDLVLQEILAIEADYPIRAIAFDRGFQGSQTGTNLLKHFGDDRVKAFPQGIISMNAPFRELIELIVQGRIHHGGDPVTRWMMSNCAAETRGGLIKPSKEHSADKIDICAAACMALGLAMTVDEGGSVYEGRGIEFV